MSLQLISEGTLDDLQDNAEYFESFISEGDEAELHLTTIATVPNFLVSGLNWALEAAGVNLSGPVSQQSGYLKIRWRKGFPWLPVIVAVILGILALLILINGYRLFQVVSGVIPEPLKPVFGIIVAALLGVVLIKAVRPLAGSKLIR